MNYTLVVLCPWCGYSEVFEPEETPPEACPVCGTTEMLIMAYRSSVSPETVRTAIRERPAKRRFNPPTAIKLKKLAPIQELEPGIFRVDLKKLLEFPIELAEEGVGRFRLLVREADRSD